MFSQVVSVVGDLQIISSVDELFNHVDEGLPMWAEDGDRAVTMKITFDKAFRAPPSISLGLTGIDSAHDQNLRFSLSTIDAEATGFTIRFSTWGDTHIARASVSWQALGLVNPDIPVRQ